MRKKNILKNIFLTLFVFSLAFPFIMDAMGGDYFHTVILCGPLNLVYFTLSVAFMFLALYFGGGIELLLEKTVMNNQEDEEEEEE